LPSAEIALAIGEDKGLFPAVTVSKWHIATARSGQ